MAGLRLIDALMRCPRLPRQLLPLRCRKVKGHSTSDDVAAGRISAQDKAGNDAANDLAVAGAASIRTPDTLIQSYVQRVRLTVILQAVAISIEHERLSKLTEQQKRDEPALGVGDPAETNRDHPIDAPGGDADSEPG